MVDTHRDKQQFYFQSPDTTMRSSTGLSQQFDGKSGASLYAAYMSDIHTRRLRKGQSPPPADAAGLIAGAKFHGRGTPLKGKGYAPPDDKQQEWVGSKSVAGNRHGTSNLLRHDETDDTQASLFGTRSDGNGVRSLSRMMDQSFKSHLKGAGMEVSKDENIKSQSKNHGLCAPTVDTVRVFAGCGLPVSAEDTNSSTADWQRSKCRPWAIQLAEAEGKKQAERPQTAPSKLSKSMTIARQHYHSALHDSNLDVFQYRHSGGICPAEYKFAEVRQQVPKHEVKPVGSAKEVFFDTRASYSSNRVKGLQSNILC